MRGAADLEDLGVARQAHLDEHVLRGHLGHQARRVGLRHDVEAVADALGVAGLDGGADVERVRGAVRRQVLRRSARPRAA